VAKRKKKKAKRKAAPKKSPKGVSRACVPTTQAEIDLATWGLYLLENNHLEVGLAPAPQPRHRGHKVRVAISQNPAFYRRMAESRGYSRATGGGDRGNRKHYGSLRQKVMAALKRVIAGQKIIDGMCAEALDELEDDARHPERWT
jgi:hypothetical protein